MELRLGEAGGMPGTPGIKLNSVLKQLCSLSYWSLEQQATGMMLWPKYKEPGPPLQRKGIIFNSQSRARRPKQLIPDCGPYGGPSILEG